MPLSPHAFYKDSRIGSLPRSGLDDVTALALSRPTGITAPPGARPTIKSRPWIFPARLFSGYLKRYGMMSGYRVTARYDTAGDFLNSTARRGMTGAPHRHHDRAQTKSPATRRSHGALSYRQCVIDYLFRAVATSTAQATVQPTMGLLPIPRKPIISTWAGTDEEPAN